MISALRRQLKGDGIGARVKRGSALTLIGFGTGQAMRLGSNLILTRLLFPEAFGLMAIVSLFLTGLQMISDVGLVSVIVRSKRGDDPVFLNTCWTLMIIRGVILAGICVAAAAPLAEFYGEPILEEMMYGVAFTVFIIGLRSTKIATSNRNILLGRITMMDLGCQLVSIIVMIGLALVWESVWALMAGLIIPPVGKTILSHLYLPGHSNRLQIERAAFWEQFHFGKYLFISSGMTFIIENGDRILLSKFLSLASLGFYNIAYFFAALPVTLMANLVVKVLYPLYSARRPSESRANRKALSKTRFVLTGAMFSLLFTLGLLGQWLVDLLYTDEYQASGPLLVMISLSLMPSLIIRGYPPVLLAAGKSRQFTGFQLYRMVMQTSLLALGLTQFGLIGALAAQPLAALLSYPVLLYLIRPEKGEDLLHDGVFATLTVVAVITVLSVNPDVISLVSAIE